MTLDEWSAAEVEGATGASPPAADEWTAVEVPGPAGRFAGADTVAYRTRFPDPRDGDQPRALLTLKGLYARARIWLNGDLLGTHDTYFEPARFRFEPEADNELVVECRSPDDRFGGVFETDAVPAETSVPGIHWGAEVEGIGPAAVTDVDVRPRLTDPVGFDVRATVDAAEAIDDSVTFSLRPGGFRGSGLMEQAPVTAAAGGTTTVEHTIELDEPRYWYPRGHGPQHRYEVSVRFRGQEVTRSTGLRTVERDEDGFLVNGRRIRLRGFNRLPGGDPEDDVDRAVEANANFVRAHAHVPSHEFHSACDEAGLLVFQDLPLTGPGGYDVGRAKTLAAILQRRYGQHPSVGMYGVHDGPRTAFEDPVGSGRTARYRIRWRVWRSDYNATPDESVAGAFPDDAVVFPVAGPLGTDPDAAHLYPGWDYGKAADVDWLLDRNPSLGEVVSEFGAGALATDEDGDVAGLDRRKHDAHVTDGVEASQAYQANVVKTVAESLRRRGSHAMATYALRDADVGGGMGVLASDGTEKTAFDAVADAYEPVQATLSAPPSPGEVETTVVNDTGDSVSGTLTWQAGEQAGEDQVAVDAFERSAGPTVTIPGDADVVTLTLSLPDRTVENRYRL